jgi:hypothetical protein
MDFLCTGGFRTESALLDEGHLRLTSLLIAIAQRRVPLQGARLEIRTGGDVPSGMQAGALTNIYATPQPKQITEQALRVTVIFRSKMVLNLS